MFSHSNHSSDELQLINRFTLDLGEIQDTTGLEGLTVDTTRGILYAANEKLPKAIYKMHLNGTLISEIFTEFSKDLSGLSYDEALDILWAISDESERYFYILLNF